MKFKQSIPLLNLTADRIPNANDDNTCGFGVGSIWEYAGVMYTCTNSSTGLAVWVNVGGSSTFEDLTDSPYDNTQLATALNSKQDRLAGIAITKEFDLDFDGIEDTFEKTHTYNNDYITYSIRKADGSYYKETEYDVSSTTTTFTIVFVTPPAAGTGKLTLQSVQNAEPAPSGSDYVEGDYVEGDYVL